MQESSLVDVSNKIDVLSKRKSSLSNIQKPLKRHRRNRKVEKAQADKNIRQARIWQYDLQHAGGSKPGFLQFDPIDIEYMVREYDELVECQDDVETFLNFYPVSENIEQYWCFISQMLPDKRHEKCMENEELRKCLFQKMVFKAKATNNNNFLNAGYDHNSMKTCARTGSRYYICSSFGFIKERFDGLNKDCKSVNYMESLLTGAIARSRNRARKKGIPQNFQISIQWLFETLVRLKFRCKLSRKRLHATPRWEGSLTIDRDDNDADYTLKHSRIIVNSLQCGQNYVMTPKFLNAYLDPECGLQESLDDVGFTVKNLTNPLAGTINDKLRRNDEYDPIEHKWYRICNCVNGCGRRLELNDKNFEPRTGLANKGYRYASRACRKNTKSYYARLGDNISRINKYDKNEKFKGTNIVIVPITREEVVQVYIQQGGRCAKSKLPLRLDAFIKGVENSTAQNISIDAIDPTKPHKNNFQLVCAIYNVQNQGRN